MRLRTANKRRRRRRLERRAAEAAKVARLTDLQRAMAALAKAAEQAAAQFRVAVAGISRAFANVPPHAWQLPPPPEIRAAGILPSSAGSRAA